MSFSLDFSSPISTGDFQCLDDYMLSHSVNEYKTYSDLCSLSLSSITSLQTALNLIKTAVTDLLSMPQSFTYLKNISTFISLKIISNQLSDILHTVVSSEKKFILSMNVNLMIRCQLSKQKTFVLFHDRLLKNIQQKQFFRM